MVKVEITTPEKDSKKAHTICKIEFEGDINQQATVMCELEKVVREILLKFSDDDRDILYVFAHGLVHNE